MKRLACAFSLLLILCAISSAQFFNPLLAITTTATVPTTFAYRTTVTSTSAGSNPYSFAGVSFGTADANRIIVIQFGHSYGGGGVGTPTSLTIGGVSATSVQSSIDSNMAIFTYYAAVPTGTTGTISIGGLVDTTAIAVSVWSIVTSSPTPASFNANSASGGSPVVVGGINVIVGSVVLGFGYNTGAFSGWTATEAGGTRPLTERVDTTVGSNGYAAYDLDSNDNLTTSFTFTPPASATKNRAQIAVWQ